MSQKFRLVFSEPPGEAQTEGRPDAGGEADTERAEYDRLVKEKYKAFYTEDTQKIINRRFRDFKELQEKLEAKEQYIAELTSPQLPDLTGQAEAFKAENPDFDLELELETPEFASLIKSGLSLEQSWKAVHLEDIINKAAESARDTAERDLYGRIRAGSLRPAENGITSQGGLVVKNDVSKLTRRERAAMASRALRGEHIVL